MSSKLNFSNKFQATSTKRCKNTNFPINKQKPPHSTSNKRLVHQINECSSPRMALELGHTRLPQATKFWNNWSKKWNNLHLNEAQKALTFNALARKAKARLHEKMGNLAFRNFHNSLIINNVHRIPACRLSDNWRVSPCRTTASSVSEPNLTSGCIAPMSARTTLLQMPELLFLLLPC